ARDHDARQVLGAEARQEERVARGLAPDLLRDHQRRGHQRGERGPSIGGLPVLRHGGEHTRRLCAVSCGRRARIGTELVARMRMARRLPRDARLCVATHNAGKAEEIVALFAPRIASLVTATALDVPEPEESGPTFAAIACAKAR